MSLSKNNGVSPKLKASTARAVGRPPSAEAAAAANRTERRERRGITGILPSRISRGQGHHRGPSETARNTFFWHVACHTAVTRLDNNMSRFLDRTIVQFFAPVILPPWHTVCGQSDE